MIVTMASTDYAQNLGMQDWEDGTDALLYYSRSICELVGDNDVEDVLDFLEERVWCHLDYDQLRRHVWLNLDTHHPKCGEIVSSLLKRRIFPFLDEINSLYYLVEKNQDDLLTDVLGDDFELWDIFYVSPFVTKRILEITSIKFYDHIFLPLKKGNYRFFKKVIQKLLSVTEDVQMILKKYYGHLTQTLHERDHVAWAVKILEEILPNDDTTISSLVLNHNYYYSNIVVWEYLTDTYPEIMAQFLESFDLERNYCPRTQDLHNARRRATPCCHLSRLLMSLDKGVPTLNDDILPDYLHPERELVDAYHYVMEFFSDDAKVGVLENITQMFIAHGKYCEIIPELLRTFYHLSGDKMDTFHQQTKEYLESVTLEHAEELSHYIKDFENYVGDSPANPEHLHMIDKFTNKTAMELVLRLRYPDLTVVQILFQRLMDGELLDDENAARVFLIMAKYLPGIEWAKKLVAKYPGLCQWFHDKRYVTFLIFCQCTQESPDIRLFDMVLGKYEGDFAVDEELWGGCVNSSDVYSVEYMDVVTWNLKGTSYIPQLVSTGRITLTPNDIIAALMTNRRSDFIRNSFAPFSRMLLKDHPELLCDNMHLAFNAHVRNYHLLWLVQKVSHKYEISWPQMVKMLGKSKDLNLFDSLCDITPRYLYQSLSQYPVLYPCGKILWIFGEDEDHENWIRMDEFLYRPSVLGRELVVSPGEYASAKMEYLRLTKIASLKSARN